MEGRLLASAEAGIVFLTPPDGPASSTPVHAAVYLGAAMNQRKEQRGRFMHEHGKIQVFPPLSTVAGSV